MHPHRLEFCAIGSYADEVTVDFEELARFGLFHIHGPTGAGKSTLLDAMCFALYGTVPSPRRSDGLRSQHAVGPAEARATLDFSAQDADWRITRTPTQYRAKKSGSGMTEQRATATLLRKVDGSWQPHASGLKEVDTIIHQLLGLDAEQFMQVVVLPQGSFQKALRAGADERAELLSTLFHTGRFGRYSARLKDRADELQRDLAHKSTGIRGLVSQAQARAESLDIVTRETTNAPLNHELKVYIRELATQSHQLADESEVSLKNAQQIQREASEALQVIGLKAEKSQRRQTALTQLDQLAQEQASIDRLRNLVEAINKSGKALALMKQSAELRSELEKLDTSFGARLFDIKKQSCKLPAFAGALAVGINDLDEKATSGELDKTQQSVRDVLGNVQTLIEQSNQLSQLESSLASHLRSHTESEQLLVDTTKEIDELTKNMEHLKVQQSSLQTIQARKDSLTSEVERLSVQLNASQKLVELNESHKSVLQESIKAERAALDAQASYLKLFQQRLDGIASELASKLLPGESCSVCGSKNHPEPALLLDVQITSEDVEKASKKSELLHAKFQELKLTTESLAVEIQAQSANAGPDGTHPTLIEKTLIEAKRALVESSMADKKLTLLTEELSRTDSQLDAAKGAVAQCKTKIEQAAASAKSVQDSMTVLQKELREALGDSDPVTIQSNINNIAASIDDLSKIVTQISATKERLVLAKKEFDVALGEIRTTKDDLQKIAAEAGDIKEHELTIRAHESLMVAAQSAIKETEGCEEVSPDALADASTKLSESEIQRDSATALHARIKDNAEALEKLAKTFSAELKKIEPLQRETERVTQLAELCRGVGINEKRMSLERYVLAAFLEEVAESASQRLRVMTSGRYTLIHSDARVRGNAASGLSLLVLDAFTGEKREVNTLSGGETFLASLALALGLADVVQRHSGGVHIDALFIDEGFGSLDPETLDLAVAELDRLREGGRLVGVISHVPALRERIPAGIEVIAGADGSHIKVCA